MNYEYIMIDQLNQENLHEGSVVSISGQFNDFANEPMINDPNNKKRYTYTKEVDGGQIYNYYLYIDGEKVIDQNQNKNRQGTANWIFVPFNEVNQLSSQTLTGRSLELRVLKIKKLAQTISFIKEI